MKHLLVLGASYSVVPLIRAAKGLGAKVTAASIPGDYPGFAEADGSLYVDITNPEEVLKAAEALGPDGAATCCMDVGLKALGRVCSALSLKGPSYEAVTRCTNKYLMKQAFLQGGVRTPKSVRVSSEEELEKTLEEFAFPIVTKAVDQMGSRGIYVCRTKQEARENYGKSLSFSRESYCLVEEYIEGTLFGVEGMIRDGSLVFALPDGTFAYQGFTPTPIGHYIPAPELESAKAEILKETEKAVRALSFDNTPFNCDFILRDNVPYCIEATARAGANCLPELISLHYGVNYYEEIARLALGMETSPALGHHIRHEACLSYVLHSKESGILESIQCDGPEDPRIKEISFNVQPGDRIRAYTNGRDRLGQVIIAGASAADTSASLADVLGGIRVNLK